MNEDQVDALYYALKRGNWGPMGLDSHDNVVLRIGGAFFLISPYSTVNVQEESQNPITREAQERRDIREIERVIEHEENK